MSAAHAKRAFISYVHENGAQVDELCRVLEAAGIPYWRDRNDLGPGDLWREEIRRAIQSGALAFLACFSKEQVARSSSHMNEELTLAVDEFRRMPPGHTWLIPVRLDDTPLPDWNLGGGIRLDDLNYVDLFGASKAANAAALATRIHRLMGDRQLSAASAMEAVESATDAARVDLVRSMTKQMVLDPSRRIELDDLVVRQANTVTQALRADDFAAGPLSGASVQVDAIIAERAIATWKLAEPFCTSLQVAAQFSSADGLVPWSSGIRSFVAAANRSVGGLSGLIELRHVPGSLAIMTAGVAAVTAQKWENLSALVVRSSVPNQYDGAPLTLLEATDPHKAFAHGGSADAMLSYAAQKGITIDDVVVELGTDKRMNKGSSAPAQWAFEVLRPLFVDQIPDSSQWEIQFNRAEVFLGLLAEDAHLQSPLPEHGHRYRLSYWIGRAANSRMYLRSGPLQEWAYELERDGSAWGPLRGGLFGGDIDRASKVMTSYSELFTKAAEQRW